MREQAQIAIDMADVICFFTDARDGLTDDDREVANLLRRTGKPVLLVVNKIDYQGLDDSLYEFYELGLGDPIGISSVNMLGFGDLLDEIIRCLPESDSPEETGGERIQLAIVGRPNVGKSSLTNRLLGINRTMVSDIAGTTRDAVDTEFISEDGIAFNIIDTAGIRRKRSVEDNTLERYSVLRSIAAIKRCDVALLMIDANDGVTEQDTKIAGLIHEEGKGVLIVVNKWDMVEKETGTLEKTRKKVLNDLKFMDYAPVAFISAFTGQRVNTILQQVSGIYQNARRRVPTGVLNDVVNDAVNDLQPPMQGGRRLRIYYATQGSIQPPTFILFVNDPELLNFSYERYLENFFRKTMDFSGTPIRFQLRERKKDGKQ
jgi:GTP-binding protein